MKSFLIKAIGMSLFPLLTLVAIPTFADSSQLPTGQEEVVLKVENMT